jgi:hypothetical protein
MPNEVFRVITNILPISLVENDSGIAALIDKVLEVLASERGVAAKESVCDYAERPHINRLSVALLQHDFWGGITKRPSHCCEDFVFRVQHLCDAEISKYEVGLRIAREIE